MPYGAFQHHGNADEEFSREKEGRREICGERELMIRTVVTSILYLNKEKKNSHDLQSTEYLFESFCGEIFSWVNVQFSGVKSSLIFFGLL